MLSPRRSERVADLVMCIGIFGDCSFSKPLEELVLPEMPFAPRESEYCDDSDSQTMNHLEQFRQDQRRDTLVSASGSSGSLCEAGQLEPGFLKMLHDDDNAFPELLQGHPKGARALLEVDGCHLSLQSA